MRKFVRLLIVITAMLSTQILAAQKIVQAKGDHLVFQEKEFIVKGMNYGFKDAMWPSTGVPSMWQKYEKIKDSIDYELSLAESLKINTVRFFIHYKSLGGGQITETTVQNIKKFVNLCHNHGMKVIPTLFDFDYVDDNSYSCPPANSEDLKKYISKIVSAFDNQNDRSKILAYDIKNEIDSDTGFSTQKRKCWAEWVKNEIRAIEDTFHLITIGLRDYTFFDDTINNIVDIISFHWSDDKADSISYAFSMLKDSSDKPILVEEFGKETNLDRSEYDQATLYNTVISLSQANHIAGYMFWTLNDFSRVPTTLDTAVQKHMGIFYNSKVPSGKKDYEPKLSAKHIEISNSVYWWDDFLGHIGAKDTIAPGWIVKDTGSVQFKCYFDSIPGIAHSWSPELGCVAITKQGTSDTNAIVCSPLLENVNIQSNDSLELRIKKYLRRRVDKWGDDCTLDIGLVISPGQDTIWLEENICSKNTLEGNNGSNEYDFPHTFYYSLVEAVNQHYNKDTLSFRILLRLQPFPNPTNHGHSASFEIDWIKLLSQKQPYVNSVQSEILNSISLSQNYPNPFNSETTIVFHLSNSSMVSLKLYNALGQELEILFEEYRPAGTYQIQWRPKKEFPGGIYFYKLQAGTFSETRKMIFQK